MAFCLLELLSAISALPTVFWSSCVLIESESQQSGTSLIAARIDHASSFYWNVIIHDFSESDCDLPIEGICLGMLVQGKKKKIIKLNCKNKYIYYKCTQNKCWFSECAQSGDKVWTRPHRAHQYTHTAVYDPVLDPYHSSLFHPPPCIEGKTNMCEVDVNEGRVGNISKEGCIVNPPFPWASNQSH